MNTQFQYKEVCVGIPFAANIYVPEIRQFWISDRNEPILAVTKKQVGSIEMPFFCFRAKANKLLGWRGEGHYMGPMIVLADESMTNDVVNLWNYYQLVPYVEDLCEGELRTCKVACARRRTAEEPIYLSLRGLKRKKVFTGKPTTDFVDCIAEACLDYGMACDEQCIGDLIMDKHISMTRNIQHLFSRNKLIWEVRSKV